MDPLRLPDGVVIACTGRDVIVRSAEGDTIWFERADLQAIINYLTAARRRDCGLNDLP